MLSYLARVFDHTENGESTESGYFIEEPDALEAVLTAYDLHESSKSLHEGVDELPNVELEHAQEVPNYH